MVQCNYSLNHRGGFGFKAYGMLNITPDCSRSLLSRAMRLVSRMSRSREAIRLDDKLLSFGRKGPEGSSIGLASVGLAIATAANFEPCTIPCCFFSLALCLLFRYSDRIRNTANKHKHEPLTMNKIIVTTA